jgi:hypothetical protein
MKTTGIPRKSLALARSHPFILPRTNGINYKTSLQVTRTVSLSLDKLKSVKDAKVEITFDE